MTSGAISEGELRAGLVSIVMATYNRAGTLPRAIDSILAQDYPDWELIIVDDGSTDETLAVLGRYEDPRIRVARHEANRGVTAAKNTGLDHVRGEWFTFVDSDDEILPDSLSSMLAVVKAHPDVDAVLFNCVSSLTGEFTGTGLTDEGYVDFAAAAKAAGQHWGLTKTRLLQGERFDERISGLEGVLWLKISARARRYYVPRGLKIYHLEGGDRISHQTADLSRYMTMLLLLCEDEEYLRLIARGDRGDYGDQMFMMTLANVVGGRRRRAWAFLREYDGSLLRKGFLVSAFVLGRRWVMSAFTLKRRVLRQQTKPH